MVALTVVVLGLDHYTSTAQGGGGVDGEDHVGRYRLVHVNTNLLSLLHMYHNK